jgi:DNA topoisomerase II
MVEKISKKENNDSSKKMAVEKIYQKKSQLEHILLRPDTYIGSVEKVNQEMWIWDFESEKMIKKEITFVPGLFKIFDEILVNAADNKVRDKTMNVIKITIDKKTNTFKIYNNGKGIPVVIHKDEKVFVPTLIFGHLLTSSNYDDNEKKVTGGRNGYGAKLCNIFSKKFVVETSCRESKQSFKQTWNDNMSKTKEPTIHDSKDEDFTQITFQPDLEKFGMEELDDDTIALLARRAYDVAASTRGVKVFLNNKRLPINKFEDYCKLYVLNNSSGSDDIMNSSNSTSNAPKIFYESPNPRWFVNYLTISIPKNKQVSFIIIGK